MPSTAHIDPGYLLFSGVTLALLAVAQRIWWRSCRGKLVIASWVLLTAFLVAGWFWVAAAGKAEQRRIETMMEGYAPTYAREMERMHHERLGVGTAPDDPLYLEAISAEKRWLAANPSVNDVYTMRKLSDGRVALIVDSETDYDHDGKYEAEREKRTPIGTPYEGDLVPIIEQALAGKPAFMQDVYSDPWGTWVSAMVPLYDSTGKVEAALGVDFDARQWLAAGRRARLTATIYLIAALVIAVLGGAMVYLFVRGNLEAQRREQEIIEQEKSKLDEANTRLKAEIQEKSAVQEALARSEEKLTRAFEAFPMAVALVSAKDGACVQLNRQFETTTGFSSEDIIGHPFWNAAPFRQAGSADDIASYLHHPESSRRLHCEFQTKAGATRQGIFWTELFSAGGDWLTLAILQDVSEQHALEQQLRHAQKMEAVGHLAAGVAHDFNNLLTVIQGHASLYAGSSMVESRIAYSFQQVAKAAERAAELTRQLLTFSRKQPVQKRGLRLRSVVVNLAAMLQRLIPANIQIEYRLEPRGPAILADAGSLEQAVVNLVVNARDAMPDGGAIVVKTEAITLSAADVAQHPQGREGDFLCLTVEDIGGGISPEALPHIFEPFFTTKALGKGTGMGLASVYGIVAQHEGWIEVRSELGKGSAFKMFFPVAELAESAEVAPAVAPDSMPVSETILIAEDNAAVRELARCVLEQEGYDVLEASTGWEAEEVSRQHVGPINLLLTDMMMPGGVSGCDLAQMVAAARPETRILVSSGYSLDQFDADFELERGVNYLPKPYVTSQLLAAVAKTLHPAMEAVADTPEHFADADAEMAAVPA